MGGGEKIVFGREKKIVRGKKTIIACFTCLQLNVTLLYIGVCEYAYIRMTDHEHRTYEAIRTYIYKYALVWVCARVATKKKSTYKYVWTHVYVYIHSYMCVCVCVRARAV